MMLSQCDGMDTWVKGCSVCIPGEISRIVSIAYNALMLAVPLLLILSGMITLTLAITKKSEEDIKKAQKLLGKKAFAGAIVLLLFAFVKMSVDYLDDSERKSVSNCFNNLINYNNGENLCYFDGPNFGDGCDVIGNPDFFDYKNACIAAGADGAILNADTAEEPFHCYIRDDTCCCTVEGAIPYRTSENKKENTCYCAIDFGAFLRGGNDGEECSEH